MPEQTPHQRARGQLPTVILTLLSIVQALALELLWSRIQQWPELFDGGLLAWLGWLQVACVFAGIVLIWLVYVTTAIRFVWLPRTDDLAMPFVVGIVQFILVDSMGPDTLGPWFCAQALVFGLMTFIAQTLMRRARLDGSNDDYFRQFTPATWRDFRAPALVVAALLGAGLWFWNQPGQLLAASIAAGILLLVLVGRMVALDVFYRSRFVHSDTQARSAAND